ncbi:lasso peptide biosynthesis PqqD family chaperone [Sporosarcina thermotolerans]|uniref:Lasso peptide biosynthesis PqqD family chaperone n=1 Tax=Sporosarcina thermotolerans TaxID=633404 RepID=A0AAW9A4M9_9BACL|nr:lasso peptide biosynthesis PqqD family chaperone [Sporosarcina thermotolerans]MDW0116266.1 lasso peptide biosynthesis PqqD family chaperone [Sporosarcina thermotolerans]WHT48241.1 lasso peptide biosynthesis PqqD family chaperone [Sporosarcina thermotolerans]
MIKTQIELKNSVFNRNQGNIVSDMDGETVMLSIESGKYYNLGNLGGVIWDLMGEPISFEKLIENLLSNYDVEQSECEAQVSAFLKQLLGEGLIIAN